MMNLKTFPPYNKQRAGEAVMPKFEMYREVDQEGNAVGWEHYNFWCPGCNQYHRFSVWRGEGVKQRDDLSWHMTGNLDNPNSISFSPGLYYPYYPGVCHLCLREGKIYFSKDCIHELRDMIVDLPDIPHAYNK